jgi:hypothetical protein
MRWTKLFVSFGGGGVQVRHFAAQQSGSEMYGELCLRINGLPFSFLTYLDNIYIY